MKNINITNIGYRPQHPKAEKQCPICKPSDMPLEHRKGYFSGENKHVENYDCGHTVKKKSEN